MESDAGSGNGRFMDAGQPCGRDVGAGHRVMPVRAWFVLSTTQIFIVIIDLVSIIIGSDSAWSLCFTVAVSQETSTDGVRGGDPPVMHVWFAILSMQSQTVFYKISFDFGKRMQDDLR